MRQYVPTIQDFQQLLRWLDSDPEKAGSIYESIRSGLIEIFLMRGYSNAEDFADEAINRVNQKISMLRSSYEGNPALYFYGVAKKLLLEQESVRHKQIALASASNFREVPLEDRLAEREYLERMDEALGSCLAKLSARDRKLIITYYMEVKRAKIDARTQMAKQLKVPAGNLRVRAHRIRSRLQKCILEKLEQADTVHGGG